MTDPKVAGIILAAGGSSRLGRPKQLLDWFGKPFVKQIIDIAKQVQLDPIIVVTGAYHEEIESVIIDTDIVIVRNADWIDGQSSSMKLGAKTAEEYNIDSLIVFLCDQPHVPVELIKRMITDSQREDVDIVATSVNGKVCPPTLFKKKCITGISNLKGDQGGRILFSSYKTEIMDWQDERLLQDSDTEEDYKKLINLYLNFSN